MKYTIVCIISLLLIAACKTGSEVRTKRIAGTPVSLDVSPDFFTDPAIMGFRHTGSSATILVASVPVSYSQALEDMSPAKLEEINQLVVETEDVTVDNAKGRLYKLAFQTDGLNFKQWRMILPQENTILMLTGTFPADQDKDVSATIKNVLLTAHLDANWKPDTGLVKFEPKPDSSLRLAKVEGHSAVYTATGTWSNDAMAQYSLFSGSANGKVTNPGEFTLENFQRFCADCNILGRDSLQVTGLKGLEVWGKTKDSLGTHLKYQALLFDSTEYYMVLGTSADEDNHKIDVFRSAVRNGRKR